MKLLFATSLLPENNAASGYEIANRSLLHGLQNLGHEIVPIGFCNPRNGELASPVSINLGELSVTNTDANMRQKLVWLNRSIQNSTTFAGAKLQIVSEEAFAAIIERHGQFDGVIINGAPIAAAFEKVLARTPFVYIGHNVEWKTAEQNAKTAGSFFERTLFTREARMLKALEQRMATKAGHVFTFSDADSAVFRGMGAKSVSTVPLIVGLNAEKAGLRTPKWDAGVIGTWSWAPNRVGLDWFLNEVTPHLPESFTFAIAGKLPGNPTISHPGAAVLGRVPSALDFARDCACLPLVSRAGTGIQLKTLEAFELGLPSVATTCSVRGITNIPKNCVIQDNPRQFAAALVQAAKSGHSADIDGSLFHANQKAQMLAAIKGGLSVFSAQPVLQAAE